MVKEPDSPSDLLQASCKSMRRHVYDWNTVNNDN